MATDELRQFYEATHDGLTGLLNRHQFLLTLRKALARAARRGNAVGVVAVDLDEFCEVNRMLGTAAGDDTLIRAGLRLLAAVRPADAVARLDGDEFVALCDDLGQPAEAAVVAQRILDALVIPPLVAAVDLTASVGVAVSSGEETAEALLRAARRAVTAAKAAGGGKVVVAPPRRAPERQDGRTRTERLIEAVHATGEVRV